MIVNETPITDTIVWAEDIAKMLNVDVKTLYDNRWKDRTRCPLRRFGKQLGAFAFELRKWLNDFGKML